jgi:hypothetical protein
MNENEDRFASRTQTWSRSGLARVTFANTGLGRDARLRGCALDDRDDALPLTSGDAEARDDEGPHHCDACPLSPRVPKPSVDNPGIAEAAMRRNVDRVTRPLDGEPATGDGGFVNQAALLPQREARLMQRRCDRWRDLQRRAGITRGSGLRGAYDHETRNGGEQDSPHCSDDTALSGDIPGLWPNPRLCRLIGSA